MKKASVAVPPLLREKIKQTFMGMHVTSQSGCRYVIEMQAPRHINFDELALYYAASTYSRQLTEREFEHLTWYEKLNPTIAIHILGYDANRVLGIKDQGISDSLVEHVKNHPMPEGQFI